MGRPPKVDHVRQSFLSEISSAESLIDTIDTLPRRTRNSPNVGVHPKQVNQITELAFMGVVAAWEEFLERTFVRYVAGATTDNGYAPSKKHGFADSISHAYELLSQDPNYATEKHYLKVNDSRWVWRTADFFFYQHSFVCLQNKQDLLKNANQIRNRIAHSSQKCKADFKSTAIWFLQPQNGTLSQGFSPGALLHAPVQRNFGQQSIQAGQNHFQAYMALYKELTKSIVP